MAWADIQTSFAGGELSPALYGRVDLEKFNVGAALIRNFFVNFRGGVSRRKGTRFISGVKGYTSGASGPSPRLLPFIVGTEASYLLEFGDAYVRAYRNGALVDEVVTPYALADIALLKYAQSADVMTLCHPSYPPANLTRTDPTTFDYAAITVGASIDPPVLASCTATNGGDYFYSYIITAVSIDGKQESLPSNIGADTSEILDETMGKMMRLEWTAPAQAVLRYHIYKWGPISKAENPATVWGFIGSSQTTQFTDNNIAPDFSKEPPQWGDPFSGGQLQTVNVATPGSGYVDGDNGWADIPYVPLDITGDGTGASGWSTIRASDGLTTGAFLTNAGANYTTATITADGEGGSGATFTSLLSDPAPLYPACVAYVQQRQVFAGADLKPETFVMSQVGEYRNFDTTPVALDSDAIVGTLAALQVNTIKSLVPVSYGLLAFTTGGSFLISGGAPGAAITPSSITAQAQASDGANDLPPLPINYDVLYVQNKGNRVRDLAFAWQRQSYTGSDISVLASHLFDGFALTEWCWSQEPDKIVWAVRNDGVMLGLTYVPDQEVFAWSRHDTQGEFRSVCSIPEEDVNAVYCIVRRYVPSVGANGWVDYIERFDSSESDCPLGAWYLDGALALPTNTPDSVLVLTSYDPVARTVVATVSTPPMSLPIVGDVFLLGCSQLTITSISSGAYTCGVSCPLDTFLLPHTSTTLKPVAGGDWSWAHPAATISGLGHLKGKEVWALADGLVQGPFTVAVDSITLPAPAAQVVVGLNFTSQLQTLYLTTQGMQANGTDQGRRKAITAMTVRVSNTRGLLAGTDFDHLTPLPECVLLDPCATFTGDARVLNYPQWDTNGQLACSITDPLPAQVLGIIAEVTPGDTQR